MTTTTEYTQKPSFCTWMAQGALHLTLSAAHKAASYAKSFSLGVIVQFPARLLSEIAFYPASALGLCSLSNNTHNWDTDGPPCPPLAWILPQLINSCVYVPINEEILFRGILQGGILKSIPRYIVKKYVPGKESHLDSKIAKLARVTLTAALFSAIHLSNLETHGEEHVRRQLIGTFFLGLCTGILKETKAGLVGAIGAHIGYNTYAQVMNCQIHQILWHKYFP